MPGRTSTETVEQSPTATWSFSLPTDTNTHTHTQPFYGSVEFVRDNPSTDTKPEINSRAIKTSHSPPALVPISQVWTGGVTLFPPSDQPREGSLPTVILFPPMEGHQLSPAISGNSNHHDVIKIVHSQEVYRDMVTMEGCQEIIYGLLNGTIASDLE